MNVFFYCGGLLLGRPGRNRGGVPQLERFYKFPQKYVRQLLLSEYRASKNCCKDYVVFVVESGIIAEQSRATKTLDRGRGPWFNSQQGMANKYTPY